MEPVMVVGFVIVVLALLAMGILVLVSRGIVERRHRAAQSGGVDERQR